VFNLGGRGWPAVCVLADSNSADVRQRLQEDTGLRIRQRGSLTICANSNKPRRGRRCLAMAEQKVGDDANDEQLEQPCPIGTPKAQFGLWRRLIVCRSLHWHEQATSNISPTHTLDVNTPYTSARSASSSQSSPLDCLLSQSTIPSAPGESSQKNPTTPHSWYTSRNLEESHDDFATKLPCSARRYRRPACPRTSSR